MTEVLVRLQKIRKEYGRNIAVNDVDLSIDRGEFVVLLGPSGSGKTTILSMMGGFTQPTAGKIFIEGSDTTHVPPARRRTVTVFQDYALFPHMTVRANVLFGLQMQKVPHAERQKQADNALRKVGLEGLGKRGVHELSGGQRQRVALARAIAVKPAVLLLDEPLGALDLKTRNQMQDELVHLQKSLGTTFIHVTHDQDEAMSIADKIVLINQGRIEDQGPAERVYLRPATLFAATFMGDTNILEANVVSCGSGTFAVATPIGTMKLSGQATVGRRLHVSLRPEQVRLGPAEGEGMVSLGEARVSEVAFRGSHKRCDLMAGPDRDFRMLMRVAQTESIRKGDAVCIHTSSAEPAVLVD